MSKVKSEHYITIMEFMVRDLELSGNELIAYALIYGFSQNGESKFEGSLSYVAKWLNCSKTTAFNILNKLSDDGFIDKIESIKNGIKFCDYKAVMPDEESLEKIKENKAQRKTKEKNERHSKKLNGVQEFEDSRSKILNGRSKNLNEGVQKTLMHNNIDILNENIKDNTSTLSGERADRACAETVSKETTNKENRKKEARDLFERLWSMYPLKKGKGSVSDTQKARLLDIGYEELERAISRYKQYVESVDYLHYKNGSTFFNSGYIDYLDENVADGIGNSEEFEAYCREQELGESKDLKKESRKERIEQAKRKAIREYKLEEGYWDGMDDAEAESFLGLLGIFLDDV